MTYESDAIQEFTAAIQDAGFTPPLSIEETFGKKGIRFASGNKGQEKDGWYYFGKKENGNGYSGTFGVWAGEQNTKYSWRSGKDAHEHAPTAEQKKQQAEAARQREAKQQAAAAKTAKQSETAAKLATLIMDSASDHLFPEYLEKKSLPLVAPAKGITGKTLTQIIPIFFKRIHAAIQATPRFAQRIFCCVPMSDAAGTLKNVQIIYPEKNAEGKTVKLFLRAPTGGLRCHVGNTEAAAPLYIVEGYAKAIPFAMTDRAACIAFSVGQITGSLIDSLDAEIIVNAADNGKAGHKQAKIISVPSVFPGQEDDFDELWRTGGKDVFEQALKRLHKPNNAGVLYYDNYLSECFTIDPTRTGHYNLIAETGAGKTRLIIDYLRKMHGKLFRAVFAAPITLIIEQLRLDLLEAGFVEGQDFHVVMKGHEWPGTPPHGLIICTYKSLHEKAPQDDEPDNLVVIDEIHFCSDADYMEQEVDSVLRRADRADQSLRMTGTPYEWGCEQARITAERKTPKHYPVDLVYYPKGEEGQDALIYSLLRKKKAGEILIVTRNSKHRNVKSVRKTEKIGMAACVLDSDEKGDGSTYQYILQHGGQLPPVDIILCTSLYKTGLSITNTNISCVLDFTNEKHLENPTTPHDLKQTISRTRNQIPPVIVGICDAIQNDEDADFDLEKVTRSQKRRVNTFVGQVNFWAMEGTAYHEDIWKQLQNHIFGMKVCHVENGQARPLHGAIGMLVTQQYKRHLSTHGKTYRESFNAFGMTINAIVSYADIVKGNYGEGIAGAAAIEIKEEQAAQLTERIDSLDSMTDSELTQELSVSKIAIKYVTLKNYFGGDAGAIYKYLGYDDAPYNQVMKWVWGLSTLDKVPGLSAMLDSITAMEDTKNAALPTNEYVRLTVEAFIKSLPGQLGVLHRKLITYSKEHKCKRLSHKAALKFIRMYVNAGIVKTDNRTVRRVRIENDPLKKVFEEATGRVGDGVKDELILRVFLAKKEKKNNSENFTKKTGKRSHRRRVGGGHFAPLILREMTCTSVPPEMADRIAHHLSDFAQEQLATYGDVF